MNAKQRKQAERVATVARRLSEISVEDSRKAVLELKEETDKLEKLREEMDIPALIVEKTHVLNQVRVEKEILLQGKSLQSMTKDLEYKREGLEADRKALEVSHSQFIEEINKFEDSCRMKEGDLSYKAMMYEKHTKPMKEMIKDILVLLEIDEDPHVIAANIRKTHDILEAKW